MRFDETSRENFFILPHCPREDYFANESRKNNTNIGTINYSILCNKMKVFSKAFHSSDKNIRATSALYICQAICFRSWMDTTELRHLVCASKKFQGLINLLKGGWSRLLLFHVNIVATAICLKKKKKREES